jgi:hypothetical protein
MIETVNIKKVVPFAPFVSEEVDSLIKRKRRKRNPGKNKSNALATISPLVKPIAGVA